MTIQFIDNRKKWKTTLDVWHGAITMQNKDRCETTLVDIMLNTTERTIGAVTNSHPAILLGATGRKSAKQPVHMEIIGYSVN